MNLNLYNVKLYNIDSTERYLNINQKQNFKSLLFFQKSCS